MNFEQYKPVPLKQNYNVSKESVWITLSKYVATLLSGFLVVWFILYIIALIWIPHISTEQEQKWFGNSIFETFDKIDIETTDEVSVILKQLNIWDETIDFTVICNEEANAFALPGNRIVLNSEMLNLMESESHLAFVYLHERSHITHRDVLYKMFIRLPITLVSTIVLGDYAGATDSFFVPFAKQTELRADREALKAINEMYGNTQAITSFMESMHEDVPKWMIWLSDHPTYQTRLNQVEIVSSSTFEPLLDKKLDIQSTCEF
jgi:Zn-dependent protease with chaperone function